MNYVIDFKAQKYIILQKIIFLTPNIASVLVKNY
jgi:hypothetical protein